MSILDIVKIDLYHRAIEKHGRISRLDIQGGGKRRWNDSFTEHNGFLVFWFNDNTGSSRVVMAKIDA